MAACSEAPTAPAAPKKSLSPSASSSHDEITCRSGYIIAYDENGNPYCAPADDTGGKAAGASNTAGTANLPATTTSSTPR
jgi:hypothetical protein